MALAVAAEPSSVHHKSVFEGLPGMEPVACLCGLAVTVVSLERKTASRGKQGGGARNWGAEEKAWDGTVLSCNS